MDRFRGVLGEDTVDEILDETEQAQGELDAAGKERKGIDEPVDETTAETEAPETAETEPLDAEAIIAFIDERIGKALEPFAEAVADEATKAIDERALLLKRIDELETLVIEVEDEYEASRTLMPRAMQAARQRASNSGETVVKDANAPAPPGQSDFALGSLVVDPPATRR